MTRIIIILPLLFSLLASGWVQASAAGMLIPTDNEQPQTVTALMQQDVPLCHQRQLHEPMPEQDMKQSHMACCDGGCQCDGLCHFMTFTVPNWPQVLPPAGHTDVAGFSPSQWLAVVAASLYRPPIRQF